MGLPNSYRNIKRVVFSSVVKFDGKAEKFISVSQLKQIAGRAGRFNTAYANGEVTTYVFSMSRIWRKTRELIGVHQ